MNPSRLAEIALTGDCSPEESSDMARMLMEARCRRSDPATSQAAARTASMAMTSKRLAVLHLFERWGPMTDEEVSSRYELDGSDPSGHLGRCCPNQSESGLRTRRSELVRMDQLVDSGRTKRMSTGRQAIVWSVPE